MTADAAQDPATPHADPLARVAWPVRTERLLLRRMAPEDATAMWAYRGRDDVSRWITSRPAGEAEWIAESAAGSRHQLVVELDGRLVGDVMLRVEDAWAQSEVVDRARGVQAELGWVIDPAAGGRGLATEAVAAAIRIAFDDLGLRRVVANAFAANTASRRLAGRVGMRLETQSVRDSLHRDLGWVDGVAYALLAEEWAATRAVSR